MKEAGILRLFRASLPLLIFFFAENHLLIPVWLRVWHRISIEILPVLGRAR